MPSIMLAASSQQAKHKHYAYIKDDGTGQTTVTNGHYHPIGIEEVTTEVANPATGLLEPQVLDRQVRVGEANGHTHELEELKVTRKRPKLDEAAALDEVHKLFKKAEAYNKDNRTRAKENEEYYCNEQWDKMDADSLESKQRPALTINLSQAAIKSLSGYQRNNRTDLKFFPREEGDARVADVLTEVSKVILDGCDYQLNETEAFLQTLINGVGYLNMYKDYNDDIKGKIVVEMFDWRDLYPGPHNKKDFSDLEFLVKTKWYSKEQLKSLFPDKSDKIDGVFAKYEDENSQYLLGSSDDSTEQPDGYHVQSGSYDAENVDINNKNIRMFELWRKEYLKRYVFVDEVSEWVVPLDDWEPADAKQLKTLPGVKLIERTTHRMRVTKVAGDVWLDDDYPELSVNDFHVIPIYAEKIRDRILGKMDFVKDLQDETNKRLSTIADILNKCNGYVTYYDEEMFSTRDDMEDFEGKYATPGSLIKLRDVTRKPLRDEGIKFPQELERMTITMVQMFDRLMNVNPELLGQRGNSESGIAQIQKIKQALMGNEYLFDNLSLAKKRMGKILVAMIQDVYKDGERIYRILNNKNVKKKIEIGGQPLETYSKEELVAMLNDSDLTKYDVAVEESSISPTIRYANFLLLSDLAGKGLPVPVPLLIELAPIPEIEKQKAMQMVQQQMQQQAASEEKKYNTEIIKTAMSKGMMPPGAPASGGVAETAGAPQAAMPGGQAV